ncbi:acyl carrier protein [Oryzomicrobium terrae]|uniref:Acyl carrier protein n=1 Tax=Oryzomicrobium terrae TaxID=1735038 RepID=A0A5C1E9G0_9RHOO|nr:acyl carrier protein [Oryzomicrobium terrae]QEL65513.1 acyl carrier protein [Oryzomicrobium terrae]
MDTLTLIRDFIHEKAGTPLEQITTEAVLQEIGVDSLMLLDLMFDFEDHHGIKLPTDTPNPKTVGELVEIFDKFATTEPSAGA